MGCINSKADINDTHPNVFVVYNIDDASNKISEGHLEVTEGHILLHQKGKDAVKWPLKSLRRYGAEGEIFSFESGRKCETGPGIYAFRCARAERLLATLQERVRSNTTSTGNAPPTSTSGLESTLDHALTSSNFTRRQSEDSVHHHNQPPMTPAGAAGATSLQPLNTTSVEEVEPELIPEYANVNCNGGGPLTLEASDGYLVPNTPVHLTFANNLFQDSREYENVGLGGSESLDHCEHLLPHLPPKPSSGGINPKERVFFREDVNLNPEPSGNSSDIVSDVPQINYIAVDFETSGVPSSPGIDIITPLKSPPFANGALKKQHSPPELRGEYCTIDIDRTKALSNTAKQQSHRVMDHGGNRGSDSPVGVRKTRHNSSLSELATVGVLFSAKRNSVIGD